MIVHVSVTAEDIENGIRRDNWHCPVAKALFRATGIKFSVGSRQCHRIDTIKEIDLPESVENFIQRYDDGMIFPRPMEFYLEIDVPTVPTVADVVRD
jgi:hypothetical protein